MVTDGRYDPKDDSTQFRYLCDDPSVVVYAYGVGDMFNQTFQSETLNSIACNKPGKDLVHGLRRFADLAAEEFLQSMEDKLCPSESASTQTAQSQH